MDYKILVVDDEASIVNIIAYNLKKEGYQVITASDGEQAYELAMAEHPDLVAGYYKGKVNLAKALMGAAMGLSGGKANPALLQRLMDEALEKGREAGK